jgi:hypothetical protein
MLAMPTLQITPVIANHCSFKCAHFDLFLVYFVWFICCHDNSVVYTSCGTNVTIISLPQVFHDEVLCYKYENNVS